MQLAGAKRSGLRPVLAAGAGQRTIEFGMCGHFARSFCEAALSVKTRRAAGRNLSFGSAPIRGAAQSSVRALT
jgi:hypothetical protein